MSWVCEVVSHCTVLCDSKGLSECECSCVCSSVKIDLLYFLPRFSFVFCLFCVTLFYSILVSWCAVPVGSFADVWWGDFMWISMWDEMKVSWTVFDLLSFFASFAQSCILCVFDVTLDGFDVRFRFFLSLALALFQRSSCVCLCLLRWLVRCGAGIRNRRCCLVTW